MSLLINEMLLGDLLSPFSQSCLVAEESLGFPDDYLEVAEPLSSHGFSSDKAKAVSFNWLAVDSLGSATDNSQGKVLIYFLGRYASFIVLGCFLVGWFCFVFSHFLPPPPCLPYFILWHLEGKLAVFQSETKICVQVLSVQVARHHSSYASEMYNVVKHLLSLDAVL